MSINSDNNIKYDARFKKPQYIPDELYKAIQEKYGCTPNEYYAYYYGGENIEADANGEKPDLTGAALAHFDEKDTQLLSVTKNIEEIYNDNDAFNEVKASIIMQLRNEFVENVRKLNNMYLHGDFDKYDTDNDSATSKEGNYTNKLNDLLGNFGNAVKRIIGSGTVTITGSGNNEAEYTITNDNTLLDNLLESCEYKQPEEADSTTPFSTKTCYQDAGITSIPSASSKNVLYTTQEYTQDEWLGKILPMYVNAQVSKAFNLTRTTEISDRPDYSEWNIYSYEEILAMEASGAEVPDDLLAWAHSMQEAETAGFVQEGDEENTDTTDEASLKDIEKKTQELNEKTQKSQEEIENDFEDLKLVVNNTQKLKDQKEDELSKSLDEMNSLSKEYKDLYKKNEEGELSTTDQKRFNELYKLLNGEDGVLTMNIKASSGELEELISSIDNIDLEIDTCVDLGNETLEMAKKLADFNKTADTSKENIVSVNELEVARSAIGDVASAVTDTQSGDLADIASTNANNLIEFSNTLDDTLLSEQYVKLYDFATLTVKSFDDYSKEIEEVEAPEETSAETEGETKELSKAEKFMQEMEGKSLIEIAYALLKQDIEEETKVLKNQVQLGFIGLDSEVKEKTSDSRTKSVEKQVKNLETERKALLDKQKKEPAKFDDKDQKRLEKIDQRLEKAGESTYEYVNSSLETVNEYNQTLEQGELRGDDAIDFGELTTDVSAELLKWSLAISLAQPVLALTAMALSASTIGLGQGMILSGKLDNKLHDNVDSSNDNNLDDISSDKDRLQEITEASQEDKKREAITNGEAVDNGNGQNNNSTNNSNTPAGMEGVSTDMSASQATSVGAQATTGVQGIINGTRQEGTQSQETTMESKRTTEQVEAELAKTMMEMDKDNKQVEKMAKEAEKIVAEVEKMTAEFEELQAQNDEIAAKQEREENMSAQPAAEPEPQIIEVDENGNPIGGTQQTTQSELTVTSSSSEDDINTLSTNSVRMTAISGQMKTYNGKLSKYSTQIARIQKKNKVRTRRCQKLALEKRKIIIQQQKEEEEKQKRLGQKRGVVGIFKSVFEIVGAVGAVLSLIPVTAPVGAALVAVGMYGGMACTVADSAILLSEGYTKEALIGLGVGIATTAISIATAGAGGKAAEAGAKAATSTLSNAMTITSSASQIVGSGADLANNVRTVQGKQQDKTLSTISQGAAMLSAAANTAKGYDGGISFKDNEGNKTFGSVMNGIGQVASIAGTAFTTASQVGMLIKGANGDTDTEFEDILNIIGTGLSASAAIANGIGGHDSNGSTWGNVSTIANAVGSTVSSSAQITMMIKELTGDTNMDAVEIMNIIGAGFSTVGAMTGAIDQVKNGDMNGWDKTSAILGAIGSTVSSTAQITMLIKQLGGDNDMDVETIMALIGAGFSMASAITGTIGSMVGDNNKGNQNNNDKDSDDSDNTTVEPETKPSEETEKTEETEAENEDDNKEDADEDEENTKNNEAVIAAASTNITTTQKQGEETEPKVKELQHEVSQVEATTNQQQQDAQNEKERAQKAQETHNKNKETKEKTEETKNREQTEAEKQQKEYELKQESNEKEVRAKTVEIEAESKGLENTTDKSTENEVENTATNTENTTTTTATAETQEQENNENDNISIKALKDDISGKEKDVTTAQGTVTGLEAKGIDLEKQLKEAKAKGQDTTELEKQIAQNKLDIDNAKKELRKKEEELINSKKKLTQKRNDRIDKINKWMNITSSTLSTGTQIYDMVYALTSSNDMTSEEKADTKSQLKLSDSELERLKQARIRYNRARARGVVA